MNNINFSPTRYAVEGTPDEEVLKRLAKELDIKLGVCYGKEGKLYLRKRINSFNQYARFYPFIVLADLDNEHQCAPDLKTEWIPNPAQYMCFRVAVIEIESWLLADRENIAKFLSVSKSIVPTHPEMLSDPKQEMVNLARKSRRRSIKEDMIPRPGSGRNIGSAYNSCLIEFIRNYWSPEIASQKSDSLNRCIKRLRELR